MIYPSEVGKANETCRLNTIESIWVQGRLKRWGRWSYIGNGNSGNMFNHLLATRKITKTAIKEIMRKLKRSGTSKEELTLFFSIMLEGKMKSSLAFCSDTEALAIDRILAENLSPMLIYLLHERYDGNGKSKRKMAEELKEMHPELSSMTCRRRIDTWLNVAEFSVYRPLYDLYRNN